MLSSDASTLAANLFPRLEHLTTDMHQLYWLLRNQTPSNSYIISNLQECLQSASKILSSAKVIVEYRRSSGSEPRDSDSSVHQEESKKVAKWLPQVPSEFEGSTISPISPVPSASVGWDDKSLPRVSSKSTLRTARSNFSIAPPKYIGSSGTTIPELFSTVTSRGTATTRPSPPPSDAKVDYEGAAVMDMIQQTLKLGSDSFVAKEYTKAELLLRKVLKQSEFKFGVNFAWRAQLTAMLVEIYYEVGKQDAANHLLDQQCESREKAFEILVVKFVQDRKWDYIAQLLAHGFQGREDALERISRAKRWEEAKKTLLDLMTYRADERTSDSVSSPVNDSSNEGPGDVSSTGSINDEPPTMVSSSASFTPQLQRLDTATSIKSQDTINRAQPSTWYQRFLGLPRGGENGERKGIRNERVTLELMHYEIGVFDPGRAGQIL